PGLHICGHTEKRDGQFTEILYVLDMVQQAYQFIEDVLPPGYGLWKAHLKIGEWQGQGIALRIFLFLETLCPPGYIVLDETGEIHRPENGVQFVARITGGIEGTYDGPHTGPPYIIHLHP